MLKLFFGVKLTDKIEGKIHKSDNSITGISLRLLLIFNPTRISDIVSGSVKSSTGQIFLNASHTYGSCPNKDIFCWLHI